MDHGQRVCIFADLERPGMGDLVLRNVFVKVIRAALPGAKVTIIVSEDLAQRHADVLPAHSDADAVLTCPPRFESDDRAWRDFRARLTDERFDVCVIDTASIRLDATMAWLAGIPVRVAAPTGRHSDRFISAPVILPLDEPADLLAYARGYASALGMAELPPVEDLLRLPHATDGPPSATSSTTIAVHPGGARQWNRRWPAPRFGELCIRAHHELNAEILLVGGPDERQELEALRAHVVAEAPDATIDITGPTLTELARSLTQCRLLVGNDSGPQHVAAALGIPTVVLYGPSNGLFHWERFYQRHVPVFRAWPCRDIRHRITWSRVRCEYRCPYTFDPEHPEYPTCLMDISVVEAWHAIVGVLAIDRDR